MNGNFHSRAVREIGLVSFSIYDKNLIGNDPMLGSGQASLSRVHYSTVQYSTVQYSTDEPCWIMFQIYNEQRPVR